MANEKKTLEKKVKKERKSFKFWVTMLANEEKSERKERKEDRDTC